MTPHAPLHTRDLGRLAYDQALELQRALNQRLIDADARPTLLLVEHDPVITLTRRKTVRDHLLADDDTLQRLGIATHETDRGGDITYHGPGQLVAYPILKLADYGLTLSSYMRLLEQTVIDTAQAFGITAHRECGATGVWVHKPLAGLAPHPEPEPEPEPEPDPGTPNPEPHFPPAKLCAMGVRIRKNTTMHGLALNVAPDLNHFELIIPCGLADRSVTSLHQLLGDRCPSMQQVKDQLTQTLQHHLTRGFPRCKPASATG